MTAISEEDNLLDIQDINISWIESELNDKHKKSDDSHWIWWIFPTEKKGKNDPFKTCVSIENANYVLKYASCRWSNILHNICNLIDTYDNTVVFPNHNDRKRIHYFIEFWKKIPTNQSWMKIVIDRLEKHDWCT